MANIRSNVYELGGDWADPILWYARAVGAMKARSLADPTAWRFYGAIHGIMPALWEQLGYLQSGEAKPTPAVQKQFWKQCQHGTWFFLPWHRGYLIAFEANVRATIVKLGGPADWTLPYWNYFKAGQNPLPPAFASANWPDGTGNNPLFVPQRYGPDNNGNVFIDLSQVDLNALGDSQFTGVASGGSPGFGGADTGFSHSAQTFGGLENQPHNMVHVLVGGTDPKNQQVGGLMSDPDTAGLDPIFWLHHANIDRLWEVWRQNPPSHLNPTDPNWLNGPASLGERAFVMPMPDGTSWTYTPSQMTDLTALNYTYDDLSAPTATPEPAARLMMLGVPEAAAKAVAPMPAPSNVEMVGATEAPVPLQGGEARTSVRLDPAVKQKVTESLAKAAETKAPDRVFLNLENVKGVVDATRFHVYVGLADGDKPEDHPELKAGTVGLFGVRKASDPDDEHGGQGLTFVLDITPIVDRLHLNNAFTANQLSVRLIPVHDVPGEAKIQVGRIAIYRQGQ